MKKNKLKVEIYLPFGSCVCSFEKFIEKVMRVSSKFKDLIDVQTKSTKSKGATQLGVQGVCVIVGDKKFFPNFNEKELEKTIKKCVTITLF